MREEMILTPELKAAIFLHLNQRLFERGLIPTAAYREAKTKILKMERGR